MNDTYSPKTNKPLKYSAFLGLEFNLIEKFTIKFGGGDLGVAIKMLLLTVFLAAKAVLDDASWQEKMAG